MRPVEALIDGGNPGGKHRKDFRAHTSELAIERTCDVLSILADGIADRTY